MEGKTKPTERPAVALRSSCGSHLAVAWDPEGGGLGIECEIFNPSFHGFLARGVPYSGKWAPALKMFRPEQKHKQGKSVG